MSFPAQVKIVEVGPRDGLQNEAKTISVKRRISLIRSLAASGLNNIEAGSFISPKWVPQMASTAEVLAGLDLDAGIHYPVLVPNLRGMQEALAAGAREVAVFAAASETFSQKNINCSISESLDRFAEVFDLATANNIRVRAYVSCVLGCPYEGEIDAQKVVTVAKQLNKLGCYEISLGDTIGTGTPLKTKALLATISREISIEKIAVHFHDTYGQALANIFAALQQGVSVIDSSVAGLGGCPYATGASGNVASEDVIYMLHGMGIHTGVDLNKLALTGRNICDQLGTPVRSKVNLALQ
ncbi:MAG: hydroxymethylglutaryl-CoA lyase [Proteobacteria bacterium]|nr:hydroxymethylglutaryl-CoA lyase [Pseudomonadota bacterium]